MKLSTLQSIWRAVGHIGILASIWCAVMLFVFSLAEPQMPWAGLAHELGYGFCGAWLLGLTTFVGFIILTVCCYRAAKGKRISKLVLGYIALATLMCLLHDGALFVAAYQGIASGTGVTSIGFSRPTERIYLIEHHKPTLIQLLEPVGIVGIPLLPITLLVAISKVFKPREHSGRTSQSS